MAGVMADDAAAVTDLFREHHLELVRLALVMVGDLATAEDVVQDAFERLHRGWHGLRQPSSGLAYVRSSVLNGCRSAAGCWPECGSPGVPGARNRSRPRPTTGRS
jgi:DNA-directed RNA polymerase specialized sigma24 family protein